MDQPYLNIVKTENDVHFLGSTMKFDEFEKEYLEVREKEGRVFSDEIVKQLPVLPKSHLLHNEWMHRSTTQNRFCKYLRSRKNTTAILDLGCGNGWFSNKLHMALSGAHIYGIEVNKPELEQAARLFTNRSVTFLYGDVFDKILEPASFDIIVLNSTAQYFSDMKVLLKRLLELIKKDGEIHFLDSPFYISNKAAIEAKKRSQNYFSGIGVQEMAKHYHHHSLNSFQGVPYHIQYNPKSIQNSILRFFGRKISLFPWIRVVNL